MQTPEEVYEALRRQGYRVMYYRVPLTDGTAPKVRPSLVPCALTPQAICPSICQEQSQSAKLHRVHSLPIPAHKHTYSLSSQPVCLNIP